MPRYYRFSLFLAITNLHRVPSLVFRTEIGLVTLGGGPQTATFFELRCPSELVGG